MRYAIFVNTAMQQRCSDHEVFIKGKDWVPTKDLQVGDKVSRHDTQHPETINEVSGFVEG